MSLRIIHFSDLHLNTPPDTFRILTDKRIFGFVNGSLIRRKYRRERVTPMVRDILNRKPDLAVFTGDAVTCMQKSEFEKTLELLSPIPDAGIPLLWTPGNHDRYIRDPECTAMLEKAMYRLTGKQLSDFPYSLDAGEFRILVFDSALPRNPVLSDGIFTEESSRFLKQNLGCGKRLIVLSHFPVLRSRTAGWRRSLKHAEDLVRAVKERKVELVLSGHDHKPYTILNEHGFGESCCGSLTKYGWYDEILAEKDFVIRKIRVETPS